MGRGDGGISVERRSVRLVAFDLDGTLVRGRTICEALAERFGYLERMQAIERMRDLAEVRAARAEMLAWYGDAPLHALCDELPGVAVAEGAEAAFAMLAARGVRTAIVSINWTFAVEAFARRFGADAWVGTGVGAGVGAAREIAHFWPADKPAWLSAHARGLGIPLAEVAAVGDSHGDVPMLAAVGHPVFVGAVLPREVAHAVHAPGGDMRAIAEMLLAR